MTYKATPIKMHEWREPVCALWLANLSVGSSEQAAHKLEKGYTSNPAGEGLGVILHQHTSEDPLGVIGLHPRQLVRADLCISSANMADFAVDEKHRTIGPALTLMKQAMVIGRSRFDFVYGIANPKSAAICKRAGMTKLGAMAQFTAVLRTRRQLDKRLPGTASALLAPWLDLGLYGIRTARRWGTLKRITLHECSLQDERMASAWSRRPAEQMLSNRSPSMLSWRFGEPHDSPWRTCVGLDGNGQSQGWVIWRMHQETAEIGDFYSTDPSAWSTALLHAFKRHAAKAGAESVSLEFLGAAGVHTAIKRAGFFELKAPGHPVFYCDGLEKAPPTLAHWYLTAFDNDAD